MSEQKGFNGAKDSIVLSSRVRLARNLTDHAFPTWADESVLQAVGSKIFEAARKRPELEGCDFFELDKVDPLQRQLWAEAHLISPDFLRGDRGRFLVAGTDQKVSIMVNEEDHLRIQAFYPDLSLEQAWKTANSVDDGLEQDLDFAFSQEWGYLTACPTNIGTGMRASLMLHIPALVMTGQAQQLLSALSQVGVITRGLFGEGTQAAGNIFQISNGTTLGKTEPEVIDHLGTVGAQVVDRERAARKGLLSHARMRLADQSHRAFGILKNARILAFPEALELISMVRLGSETGILNVLNADTLDELWMAIRPAHLESIAGRSVGAEREQKVRADVVRNLLHGTGK